MVSFWSPQKAYQVIGNDLLRQEISKKKYLIIGGTAGIGKALTAEILKRNGKVTIVGRRDPESSLKGVIHVKKDLKLMTNAQELAKDLNVQDYDVIMFTNGIISGSKRSQTEEGIEEDLAVSYLSRFAFLKKVLDSGTEFGSNRLDKSVKPRVFIMGFPGKYNKASVDDLNSEKEYKQFQAHMNTVVANEALVTYLGDLLPNVNVYGLNPGIIQTDIRVNALGKGFLFSVVEGLIGLFCKSAETYAESVLLQLLVTKDIENQSKILFECDGSVLSPNTFLTQENQEKIMKASQELLSKALKS